MLMSESVDDDLYWACHAGADGEEISKLIARGADVNARVGKGKTMTPLLAAVAGGHSGTMESLLRLGADVNATASGASPTPLHSACRNGFQGLVRILLKNGADVNALDGDQNTPADLAGKIHHHGIIRLLNDHKMNTLLSGGDGSNGASSTSAMPSKSLPHERSVSDLGSAARELEGLPSSDTPRSGTFENKKILGENNNGSASDKHQRSTSTDLQMLLTAHRQLTVRESSRDRRLQRIQDTVTEVQKGMNRFHTVVDGLRLLLVEQMRQTEEKEQAGAKRAEDKSSALVLELGRLKEEHRRTKEELHNERSAAHGLKRGWAD